MVTAQKENLVMRASKADSRWLAIVKATVARFSRGNIAAQNGRVLTPDEQTREHTKMKKIAAKWRSRAERLNAA